MNTLFSNAGVATVAAEKALFFFFFVLLLEIVQNPSVLQLLLLLRKILEHLSRVRLSGKTVGSGFYTRLY